MSHIHHLLQKYGKRSDENGRFSQSLQIGAAVIGTGFGMISRSVSAQADPTPTEGIGGIAPQPSPTQPSSVPPTPTMGVIAPPPSPTPTSEPDPVGPSPTPPSWPEPTATQPVMAQPEPEGDDQQTAHCPHPYSPFNWFCWPGSGGRWFPIIPTRDFTQQTGVAAYGLRMGDLASSDWRMEAIAWNSGGQIVATLDQAIEVDAHVSRFSGPDGELELRLTPGRASDGSFELLVDIDSERIIINRQAAAQTVNQAGTTPSIIWKRGIAVWEPLAAELGGMLGLSIDDDGPLEGPGKCAVAGFLAGNACLASLSYTLFTGNFVCDDAFDIASSWCT